MKREILYTLTIILLVAAAATAFVYNRNHEKPIPPLKQRQGPISTSSEWLNTKAAIEGLQYKIRRDKGDTQSKLLLALAYMQEARVTGEHPYYYPAALDLIDEVLDRKNAAPEVRYEATIAKGMIQLSLHKFREALETGKRAQALNARRASVYGVLCDANLELGNYNEAIKMADKMVSIRPDLMSYARISYLREIHGDLDGAIKAMELAARAGYPGLEQTSWAMYTLGGLYEKKGDLKLAALTYQQILRERPSYAFAKGGLGRLQAKQGNTREAIKLYSEAANTIPEFSFQQELARLYHKTGEHKKAKTITKELLAGFEEDQEAGHDMNLELAHAYMDLEQNYDEALTFAMKEYKKRPANIDVNKTLAAIYYHKGNYKKANSYLNKATITNSQDPGLLCLNGLVSYKLGHKAAGEKLVQQSFSLNPFMDDAIANEAKSLLRKSYSVL
jgi:tetratricopeptide (TPR) repeat protein